MILQIDPLATAVAVIALGVSIWSVTEARKAPMRARAAASRGEIRRELESVTTTLNTLHDALRNGRDLPMHSDALRSVLLSIRALADRTPGEESPDDLDWAIDKVDARWWAIANEQDELVHCRRLIASMVDPEDAVRRSQLDDQIQRATRKRDATLIELREALGAASGLVRDNVKRINALDKLGR